MTLSEAEYQRMYASPPRTLPGRVNRAALLLRGGMGRSRAFDDCFEIGDGKDVLARLLYRAHTESPELLAMMKDQGIWSEAFAACPPPPAALALSHEDRNYALSRATAGLPCMLERRGVSPAEGLTDTRLAEALSSAMGEYGGCGGPDEPSIAWCKAGLRIWASWDAPSTVQDTPVFQGVATVKAAREHWNIPNPDEVQLCLW
ncbi:MAG: hypothetical protein HQ481_18065 [Alphaproteobacteria bacterium]|nr:hypothetical protein [Alphaproteobacteria bacterium]